MSSPAGRPMARRPDTGNPFELAERQSGVEGSHLSRRARQEHLGQQAGVHVIDEAAHAHRIRTLN